MNINDKVKIKFGKEEKEAIIVKLFAKKVHLQVGFPDRNPANKGEIVQRIVHRKQHELLPL